MKKHFKIKSIAMICALAVAGIIGVSSALINKQVEETPVVEKADAAASGTKRFFLDCSEYSGYDDADSIAIHYWGTGVDTRKEATKAGDNYWYVDIPTANVTKVQFLRCYTGNPTGSGFNWQNEGDFANINYYCVKGWNNNGDWIDGYPKVVINSTDYSMTWNTSTEKWTFTATVDVNDQFFIKQYTKKDSGGEKNMGYRTDRASNVGGAVQGDYLRDQDGAKIYKLKVASGKAGKYTLSVSSTVLLTYGDPSWDWGTGSSISFQQRYTVTYQGQFYKGANKVNASLVTLTPAVTGDNYVYSGETFTANASEWNTYSYTDATSITTSYTFRGWYSNSTLTTPFTSKANVSANFTIYAKFEDLNTYTLQYYAVCDGVLQDQQQFTYGTTVASGTSYSSLVPTLYGYTFDGWYNDSACSSDLSSAYVGQSRTFAGSNPAYAKFTRLSSNKTYYIDITACASRWDGYSYVYYWGTNDKNSGQPGLLLAGISNISNLYSFTIPSDATGFLIRHNNNNNHQRTVDLVPSTDHNLFVITTNYSVDKQNGEWQDVIYYLEGDEKFTGSAATAWKSTGGVVMHEPTNDNGNAAEATGVIVANSSAVKICMLHGDVSSNSVASYWYGTLGSSYDFASNVGGNIVFGAAMGGTYSFYLKDGKVYIENDATKDSWGYIYLSSNASSTDIRVTATNTSSEVTENNARLSSISDCQTASELTYNGVKGLHKFPVYNLRGNRTGVRTNTLVVTDGTTTTTYTIPNDSSKPVYYIVLGNNAMNKNSDLAYAAVVAFAFAANVDSATNSSVCNISKANASKLVSQYDSLKSSHATAVDEFESATITTWSSTKPTYSGSREAPMTAVLYQVSKIANDGVSRGTLGFFSDFGLFGNSEDNLSTVIIIISSSIALLSITALSILVIKKRKSKEQE